MILSAFPLHRDVNTEGQTFGYERSLWPGTSYAHSAVVPRLGLPIEAETRIIRQLVKIICLLTPDGKTIAEYLAWRIDSHLYPYRVRYIKEGAIQREPILLLRNMKDIHKRLSGIDVMFVSPMEYYLNHVTFDTRRNPIFCDHTKDVYAKYRDVIDGLAHQEIDRTCLRDFISCLDVERLDGGVDIFLPKMIHPDQYTTRFITGPIRTQNVRMGIGCGNPFDTSQPCVLDIKHPEVTVYSPKKYHVVSSMLDWISGECTDFKIEYILSDGVLDDHRIHHLVSRYGISNAVVFFTHKMESVALEVLYIQRKLLHKHRGDVSIVLELTYGEEALIEIYTRDRKNCLSAVHLDIAMIALSSADVIPLVD